MTLTVTEKKKVDCVHPEKKPFRFDAIFKMRDISRLILSFLENPFIGHGAGHFFTMCPLNVTSWWLTITPPFSSITINPESINRVGKCVRIISHKVVLPKKADYKKLTEVHFICPKSDRKFYAKALWILKRMQESMETPNITHVSVLFPEDPTPFLVRFSSYSIKQLNLYVQAPYPCPTALRNYQELNTLHLTIAHEHESVDLSPLSSCRKLEKLTVEDDLQGRKDPSPTIDFSFLQEHRTLTSLSLKLNFSEKTAHILPKECPSLVELDFSYGRRARDFVPLSDGQLAHLCLPNLQRLNLAFCQSITERGLKTLPSLKWIDLSSTNISEGAFPFLQKCEEVVLKECRGLSLPKLKELMEMGKPKVTISGPDQIRLHLQEKL